MLKPWLEYDEHHTLQVILRHHGLDPGSDGKKLMADLALFCNWIHAEEQAKFNPGAKPPFLLVLLSQMGIYGAEVHAPRKEHGEHAQR